MFCTYRPMRGHVLAPLAVMRSLLCSAGAVLLAVSQTAYSQDRPDFSGAWKMDASRSESAHQAVPIGPVRVVIRQTPAEISIETRRADATGSAVTSEKLVFPLDGSEGVVSGSAGEKVKVKAHWDGRNLVTETEREIQDSTVTTLYVHALGPGAKELTIDKTLTVQHGYQFPGAKNTGKGKDVFVRIAAN